MQRAFINSYKIIEFVMDTANKAFSAKEIFKKYNLNIPDNFNVYKDASQFIFDIVCEFIRFTNDVTETDVYFLSNLFDQSWLNTALTKGEIKKYIDEAYSERGTIGKQQVPLFLIMIKLYDIEFQSEFYEKMFQSIEAIRVDYIDAINSHHSSYEMLHFLNDYFDKIKESIGSFLSERRQDGQKYKNQNTNQGNQGGQNFFWRSTTMNGHTTINNEVPEGFNEMFDTIFKDFDKYFKNSSQEGTASRNYEQNGKGYEQESDWQQDDEYESSDGYKTRESFNKTEQQKQPTEYSIYDIERYNTTVQKYSIEEKNTNKKDAVQFIWIVPLILGIVFIGINLILAILSGVALIICICIAVSRRQRQCPNCGRLGAMKVINRDLEDRERGTKRKTVTDNNPVRDLKGRTTGYITTKRQVVVDVETLTYYVIYECKHCKYRKDGMVTETHEL